jgi:diguanylate cyclase (GGDEF)-like protein
LIRSVRGEDMVARYSGDEFIAVINETGSMMHTQAVAERILKDMSAGFEVDGTRIELSVSIGIANFPDHGSAAEDLIHNADEAMYQAKRDGKNQYKIS